QEFNSVETKPPETPDYTRFAVGGISGAFVNSHFDLLPGDPAASPQNYNRVTTASSRAVRLEFMYCKTLKIMYQLTINPFNTKRQHKTILIVRDKLNRPLEFYN
ncbi:MAG: hypothetical protein LBU36_02370, partial [Clostridiales bacterium]|nr:hypothetical protein [Clostridiales bacterium]